jgi:DNA replication ATP-dependent helicase Dna2
MSIDRIRTAVADEVEATPKYFDFSVVHAQQDEKIWSVEVEAWGNARLDESFEGARAWWPPQHSAEILSVVPEDSVLHLRYCTERPPPVGKLLRVYPPLFLEPLRAAWLDPSWSAKAWSWMVGLRSSRTTGEPVNVGPFRDGLRARQQEAFALPSRDVGWLWGPPGTGKTYTLGRLLASYALQRPDTHVLLLGMTNVAVDQALVAVDEALGSLKTGAAREVRRRIKRIGTRFHPEYYASRPHLLPEVDRGTVERLAQLKRQEPDRRDVRRYAQWKEEKEKLEAALRTATLKLLQQTRLVAMTSTRALQELGILREASFDLLVFDEASQVGKCVGAVLAPLAQRVLFAGDPQQLAPIVQSKTPAAREWLGHSPFDLRTEASWTVQLDEQSRMAPQICQLISELFYGGGLRVASKEENDARWKAERRLVEVSSIPPKARLVVQRVETPGQWDPRMKSNDRAESAGWVAETVSELVRQGMAESDLLVLTPYRSQRVGIRERLRDLSIREVQVSTVHRAQGSERHTVIFDVTKGDTAFLRDSDAWRLVNVALSRAKARIVLLLSDWDQTTPLFALIAWMIENRRRPYPVERLAVEPEFPRNARGKWVRIWGEHDRAGRLRHVIGQGQSCLEDPSALDVRDALTGELIRFNGPRLAYHARQARDPLQGAGKKVVAG